MNRFISSEQVWPTITELMKTRGPKYAAIAYFGTNGARLCPLGRGSVLVVDFSQAAVRSGVTNPFEIEKLLRRGVEVYSQRGLHAKVIVTRLKALVGSANISTNSRDRLIESAVLLDEKK